MKKLDKLIILISLLVFTSSVVSLYFFDRFMLISGINGGKIIATANSIQGNVRRKPAGAFSFYPLYKGGSLQNGESVFTSGSSNVILDFINNTRIKVHENSLIVIRILGDTVEVEIKGDSGKVSGEIGDKMKVIVKTESEIVELSGKGMTEFSVSEKNGKMLIESFNKNLKVDQQGLKSIIKNETMEIGKKAEKKKKSIEKEDDKKKGSDSAQEGKNSELIGIENAYKFEKFEKERKDILSLKVPFPDEGMVFVHNAKSKIIVFPKELCLSECSLTISSTSGVVHRSQFSKNRIPAVIMKIESGMSGDFKWKFSSDIENFEGTFSVRIRTKRSIQKALKDQRSIAILN